MEIVLQNRYRLVPLKSVVKDDINDLLKRGNGVYICNFPEQEWYDYNGLIRTTNYSIDKKIAFHNLLAGGHKILSPTIDSKIPLSSKYLETDRALHFGSCGTKGRLAQFVKLIFILKWLIKNHKSFEFVLIYNFTPVEVVSGVFAKIFLKKRFIVDFEDDYLLLNNSFLYRNYFKLVKRLPDHVICINECMTRYFQKEMTMVFNGFINLDYVTNVKFSFEEDMVFLYSGALDDIRGVDLIADLVVELRKYLVNFKIQITGSGPLEDKVTSWNFPEVSYLGFLEERDYLKVLSECSACLILQKPDHPFSLGSFPSKGEYYAKFEKPIYFLKMIEDVSHVTKDGNI